MTYFLKGILIGLIFGLPIGAIGAMTVQRTLSQGLKAGLLTGLGSSVADCFYAVIGVFGLTLVSEFLQQYQIYISIFGGLILMFVGSQLIFKQSQQASLKLNNAKGIKLFLSSFVIGITNPAVMITFLFAFSYFGITGVTNLQNGLVLVCGVFLGTYSWWSIISFVTFKIKQSGKQKTLTLSNKIFGSLISLFGLSILLKNLFQ